MRALRVREGESVFAGTAAWALAVVLALALVAPARARAELQSVYAGAEYQSVSGGLTDPTGASALATGSMVSRFEQTMRYLAEGIGRDWTFSGVVNHDQPDYSSYLITRHDGSLVALSSLGSPRDEFTGGLSASWSSGSHGARAEWAGNLSSSPFFTESLTASWTESFVERTTVLGARATRYMTEQPLSWYIDTDFQTRSRPTVVHGWDAALYWDQAASERYKFSWEVSGGVREEDRPRNLGLALTQAYALADRAFARLELSRVQELRSDRLLDERGYFTLTAAELSLTFEPWVDLLLTPSYAYVVEGEDNPNNGSRYQVGSDQYGLGVRYRRGRWGVEVRAAYRATNTQLRDLTAGGGLTWQI